MNEGGPRIDFSDEDIYAEYLRRSSHSRPPIENILFKQQLAVARDPSNFIACLCTRRAGKSTGLAGIGIMDGYTYPGAFIPYIALTRQSAKNSFWNTLHEVNERHQLGLRMRESTLEARLPNGSYIGILGADQKGFYNRIKGIKTPRAMVDEAQGFKTELEPIIDEALTPAILDYNGSIIVAGTPGPVPTGLFFNATTMPKKYGWSLHSWSLFDNPFLPDARAFVRKIMKKRGWSNQHPTYLREFCAQWVQDLEALVYKYNADRNRYKNLPPGHDWFHVIGMDIGKRDHWTFSVLCYALTHTTVYCRKSFGEPGKRISWAIGMLKELKQEFKPVKIVADTGALGTVIVDDMNEREPGFNIVAAQKKNKMPTIELMNSSMELGLFKIQEDECQPLANQYLTLTKDDKGLEDPALPNDYTDATLYPWRETRGFSAVEKDDTPETPQAKAQKIDKTQFDQIKRRYEQNQGAWWERSAHDVQLVEEQDQ